MLTSYKSQAGGGCSIDPISLASANCYASDGDVYWDSYAFYPTSGVTLYFSATAVISAPSSAWADAQWSTTGPYNWISWSPDAPYSPYYYDAYAINGGITLRATTNYVGDFASVSAGW